MLLSAVSFFVILIYLVCNFQLPLPFSQRVTLISFVLAFVTTDVSLSVHLLHQSIRVVLSLPLRNRELVENGVSCTEESANVVSWLNAA